MASDAVVRQADQVGDSPVRVRRGPVAALSEWLGRLAKTLWARPLLVLLCLALFLPGLPTIQPLDLGESEAVVATRRMLDGGGLLQAPAAAPGGLAGPIGVHWVQTAVVRGLETLHLANRTGIAAYRLSALLGAVLAVLATCHWGRALVGRRAAWLGAAMLASSAGVVVAAHLATAEAPALAAGCVAMGLFGLGYVRPEGFKAAQAAGFWLALGAWVLLKGPVAALLPPLLAAGSLALADGGAARLRSLRPLWGAPPLLLLLPLVPGAADLSFGLDAAGRSGGLAGALGLPGMHALMLPATGFPAIWLALLVLPQAWQQREQPAVRFLIAWAAAALFTAEAAALPLSSALPLPPLMLLAARWAVDPLRPRPSRRLVRLAGALLAAVAALISFGTLGIVVLDLRELPYALGATFAATLLVWRLLAAARRAAWARAALLGCLLVVPLYASVLEGTLTHFLIGRTAARIAGKARGIAPGLPSERLGVVGFPGDSLRFFYGPDLQLLPDGASAARFLAEQPGRMVAVADLEEGDFHRTAAALGLAVKEEGQILTFDYLRPGFLAMVMFRVAPGG